METINLERAKNIIYKNPDTVVLDLRNTKDFSKNHFGNAICINAYNVKSEIHKIVLNKNTPIIVYCYSGAVSKPVCLILEDLGYENVFDLKSLSDNRGIYINSYM